MKEKISYGQFASILLASDTFALICYSQKISLITIYCFAISILIQFFLMIPLLKNKSDREPKLFQCICLFATLLWGALLFTRLWKVSDFIYIDLGNNSDTFKKVIISILIGVVCLYACFGGLKTLGRVAVITAGFGILCIIILSLGSVKHIRIDNIKIKDSVGVLTQIITGFALSGSLCSFVYLFRNVKQKNIKTIGFYFISKALLFSGVILLALLTGGGIMSISDFPIIRGAELCQLFTSQRIDALFIIVLVLLATVGISAETVIASEIIEELMPFLSRYKGYIVILSMLIIALLIGGANPYNIIYALIFAIVPIISIVINFRRSQK